ncbi:uncharacterized protein FOMMEDRAFT_163770 [Fomitiporia mediterranea MF3/22]|uniref:Uncharacterized protein n=1 Tax=Fomitiporia mediterranea (strain MF3/22) TaxID=694068 RepID=R7SF84_FOMME|nr:uncharacterized protein FOMMEDRAFT_163770 [Fomitiporia mediterranea MF3/22]EJC97363.1 hypothetical protein FOMMEDRAFT_163770 [Fomitiporia mediterranea MF3/22]
MDKANNHGRLTTYLVHYLKEDDSGIPILVKISPLCKQLHILVLEPVPIHPVAHKDAIWFFSCICK